MSEIPPPQYAAYPRGEAFIPFGTADKLEALAEGYYGLNYVFLGCIVSYVIFLIILSMHLQTLGFVFYLLCLAVLIGFAVTMVKKIGFGKDWPKSTTIVSMVLMGLNFFTCGIIGFIVFQQIAGSQMKKYSGVKSGFFGINKKSIYETIARMRQEEATVVPPPVG